MNSRFIEKVSHFDVARVRTYTYPSSGLRTRTSYERHSTVMLDTKRCSFACTSLGLSELLHNVNMDYTRFRRRKSTTGCKTPKLDRLSTNTESATQSNGGMQDCTDVHLAQHTLTNQNFEIRSEYGFVVACFTGYKVYRESHRQHVASSNIIGI